MSKYEAFDGYDGQFIICVNEEEAQSYDKQTLKELNAIFRAHEERKKRERECKRHTLPMSMRLRDAFCPECGKDMRGAQ